MDKDKWIASLLDDMVESQWSEDIIKQEYDRLNNLNEEELLKSAEDFEPINQFSKEELAQQELQQNDFQRQLENFSKSDYEDYLISNAVITIQDEEYFKEFDLSDEYYENLIRNHLEEEDFLDNVMKEAIAEEGYFQDYIEQHYYEENIPDYPDNQDFFEEDDEIYFGEYPAEKDEFDDLGDTSYMDQGIFKGANTDDFEKPFEYTYYEAPFFDEDLLDYEEEIELLHQEDIPEPYDDYCKDVVDYDDFEKSADYLKSIEPEDDNLDSLIRERLFEEKYLDRIFVEIIKKDEYWDGIIKEKIAGDENLKRKMKKFS